MISHTHPRHEPVRPRPSRVLVLAADADLRRNLKTLLETHGLEAGFSAEAHAVMEHDYDALLIDADLPGASSAELLLQIRGRANRPVLLLTAGASPDEALSALENGAADFLVKPVRGGELIARLLAALRRTARKSAAAKPIEVGPVLLDPGAREVWAKGKRVRLTSVEFSVLETLLRAAGRVVSRAEMAWLLRQKVSISPDRVLDVHVAHIRKKLGVPDWIATVRGQGYLFRKESSRNASRGARVEDACRPLSGTAMKLSGPV